jgi:hypothetical protein
MCLRVSYKKKIRKFFFCILKVIQKGAGSGIGSGSLVRDIGPADPDPDPHQRTMDPQQMRPILYLVYGFSRQMYCNTCVENIKYFS